MKRTIEYSYIRYRRTIRHTTAPGNATHASAERCPGCATRLELIPADTIALNTAPDPSDSFARPPRADSTPGIAEEQIIPRKRNKGDKL